MIVNQSYIFLVLSLVILSLVNLNSAQYSKCSWLEPNIDFKGVDMAYSYYAKTPLDCSNLCAALKPCTGFTFWNMTNVYQVCFLKNFTQTPTRYPSPNRFSCIMVPISPISTTTSKPTIQTTTVAPVTTVTFKPITTTLAPVTTTTTTLKPVTTTTTSGTTTTTTTLKPITTTTTSAPITTTTTSAPITSTTTTTLKPITTTVAPTTSTTTTSTPFTTTTISLTKCTVEQDAYYGISDSSDMFAANTVGECCDYCQSYAQPCLAYSFLDDQKLCYVYYGSLPAKQSRPNTLSGALNSATTTTVSTTTISSRCAFETDAFFGFSDQSDVFSATSEYECCNYCVSNTGRCTLFSYLADQQVCYTYFGTIQDKVDRSNTISGVLLG